MTICGTAPEGLRGAPSLLATSPPVGRRPFDLSFDGSEPARAAASPSIAQYQRKASSQPRPEVDAAADAAAEPAAELSLLLRLFRIIMAGGGAYSDDIARTRIARRGSTPAPGGTAEPIGHASRVVAHWTSSTTASTASTEPTLV